MAHARRKHYGAQSSDLMRSTVMLAYIRLLYDVEREACDQRLVGEARRALRQEKSIPILDHIHAYLVREQPRVLPKSPEGEAIAYTLSNWKALTRYLDDGDLQIGTLPRLLPFIWSVSRISRIGPPANELVLPKSTKEQSVVF